MCIEANELQISNDKGLDKLSHFGSRFWSPYMDKGDLRGTFRFLGQRQLCGENKQDFCSWSLSCVWTLCHRVISHKHRCTHTCVNTLSCYAAEKNSKLLRAKPHRDFHLMVFGTSESSVLLKYNSPVTHLTLWFRCLGNVFVAFWQQLSNHVLLNGFKWKFLKPLSTQLKSFRKLWESAIVQLPIVDAVNKISNRKNVYKWTF